METRSHSRFQKQRLCNEVLQNRDLAEMIAKHLPTREDVQSLRASCSAAKNSIETFEVGRLRHPGHPQAMFSLQIDVDDIDHVIELKLLVKEVDKPFVKRINVKMPIDLHQVWQQELLDIMPLPLLDAYSLKHRALLYVSKGCTDEEALWFLNSFVVKHFDYHVGKFVLK